MYTWAAVSSCSLHIRTIQIHCWKNKLCLHSMSTQPKRHTDLLQYEAKISIRIKCCSAQQQWLTRIHSAPLGNIFLFVGDFAEFQVFKSTLRRYEPYMCLYVCVCIYICVNCWSAMFIVGGLKLLSARGQSAQCALYNMCNAFSKPVCTISSRSANF